MVLESHIPMHPIHFLTYALISLLCKFHGWHNFCYLKIKGISSSFHKSLNLPGSNSCSGNHSIKILESPLVFRHLLNHFEEPHLSVTLSH